MEGAFPTELNLHNGKAEKSKDPLRQCSDDEIYKADMQYKNSFLLFFFVFVMYFAKAINTEN